MIRHLFIAAWRNMAANKLISAIAILGLAVGIAAAILMALVVRNQLTFDHFIPGYERTYVLALKNTFGITFSNNYTSGTDPRMAALLRLNIPQVESATRLDGEGVRVKRGQLVAQEAVHWADPSLLSVLPFPVLHGDPSTALAHPDGIVMTHSFALKYFGRDDAIGQVLEINGHPMTVRAVIQDMPPNASRFDTGIYLSDLSAFHANETIAKGRIRIGSDTYVRLKPGVSSADVEKLIPSLFDRLLHDVGKDAKLVRLDEAHLFDDLDPGAMAKVEIGGATGFLILFIAAANFVNLLTARAGRRSREVGVRKSCGATRRHLILQYLGEAIISAFIATIIAAALCEWSMPAANAFLQSAANLDWSDPRLLSGLVLTAIFVGLVAGAYPAFILSSFRPAHVLKVLGGDTITAGAVRNALVTLQFAILIVLIIAAAIVYQQRNYAARESLHVNIDQMLVVQGRCSAGFQDAVQTLPGVKGAACASVTFLDGMVVTGHPYKGKALNLGWASVDSNMFKLYGLSPLAGTLPRRDGAPGLVINTTAAKRMGFVTPKAALNQPIWQDAPFTGLHIVAVVPDFSLNNFNIQLIRPTVYTVFGSGADLLNDYSTMHIRLDGQRIPETLAAIDQLWTTTGGKGPINRYFLDAHMQQRYVGILRQAQMFGVFAGIAIFLACLGLVGIAVSTAERRTKEIGIRKAMGAGDGQIVALLLWQFAQPVLWANVIAWPVAWWLMRRWLSGFAYHVDLQWWVFAAASLAALLIALLTVAGQAWATARQKPVLALRYE